MNIDEKIANNYLCSLGDVVFEPNGNITPDFLLKDNIAIEVRRLNQNFRVQHKISGLEEVNIPFTMQIVSALDIYPYIQGGKSYWLSLRWQRPIGSLRNIKKKLIESIEDFEKYEEIYPKRYSLCKNVEIEIGAEAINTSKKYNIGIFSDRDRGGWMVNMYSREINHCIAEKSLKIKPHLTRYREWWLVLVDHIGGIDLDSKQDILSFLNTAEEFTKVIVINYEAEVILSI